MKILVVADKESPYLWDYFEKSKLEDVDLIISCGDLEAEYLSFLVTLYSIPVLYVHGNHDEKYEKKGPEGCVCIDDNLINFKGIRIMGLGGSMRYRQGKHQYTEFEMRRRIRRLWLKLIRYRGVDIIVSHAPAKGINDGEDLPHRGFECFLELMEKYTPKFFLHGHMHMNYGYRIKRFDQYKETTVVNAYERCIIEYEISNEKKIPFERKKVSRKRLAIH